MSAAVTVQEGPAEVVVFEGDETVEVAAGADVVEVVLSEAMGPPGPPGGDLNHVHNQSVPSDEWVIVHSLGKRPSVTVVDTSGREVVGDVVHDSDDQVTVTFTAGFAGKAYIN